ncbi:unnamed protein product [Phytophthora lilii]|uniref:Unnamed protein product n=1 Tax=Phytophthora lilii TaxID=2077276 RepID=A0A9W6WNN1_9STRA|nr:unnamed protein product [Phytophthora lilii]
MIPSRLSAKYAYDTAKVAASKKKVPFYKLLPANVTDKQFEKELNQAFAQVRLDRCIYSPAHFSLMRLWADRKWGSTTCSSSQASGDSSSSSVKMPPSTNRADLSTRKKPSKSRTRFSLPHLRLRAKKTPLQLEDFDDVSYKMEIVRLGDAADSTEDHVALLESLFLALVCLLLLGGCVAVGFATHLLDAGAEPNLVYDDLVVGEPVDLETQIQRHIAETTQADALFGEQLYRPVEAAADAADQALADELERQRYLQRILSIEKGMQEADDEVQQRIDAMRRILALKDPMEQLSEYLALKQEAQREDDVDIVEDLLRSAKRMTSEEDSEVAMLGAFFFLCDRQRPRTRGMTAMLPVVAAMMEASNGMDHSPF